jgi:hypothetical protein
MVHPLILLSDPEKTLFSSHFLTYQTTTKIMLMADFYESFLQFVVVFLVVCDGVFYSLWW